jgi:capsular exopolysaccharide synthesis family protein
MKTTNVLRLFLRHWLVIGLVTLAVGAGAFAVSRTRTPQYSATSSVYLTIASGPTAANLAQGSTYLQAQMDSFGELATSARVLNVVIDDLDLDTTAEDLAKQVTAVIPRNTVILQLSATDADPRTAASIANALATEFGQQLATVGPKSPTGTALVAAQSIEVALPPSTQTSPNTRINTLLGLLVGLAIGCGVVYAAGRLDDKLRTTDRVAALGLADVLGALRHTPSLSSKELVLLQAPGDELATEIRQLSANLEAAAGSGPNVVAVTSANRSEGRTAVAANLAAALGERGNRVVLIDADLRHPRVAAITGAASEPGLVQLLAGEPATADPAQRVEDLNFAVITAGGTDANPAAALSGDAMKAVVEQAASRYDFVIFDSAPLLPVPDTIALGKHVTDLLVVADAQHTSRTQLTAAIRSASAAGLQPIGIVLNQVRPADESAGLGYLSSQSHRAAPQRSAS